MKNLILLSTLLAASFAGAAHADIVVYRNTLVDTDFGLDLTGLNAAVGDSIGLENNSPTLAINLAEVEFFNSGTAGDFDATLQLFNVGSPVGAQFGTDYNVTGIHADDFGYADVSFDLGGITLPDNLVFMVSVSNLSGGALPQLELYGPTPSVGSNTPGTAVVFNGTNYSTVDTSGIGGGNPFFLLVETPEPSGAMLIGCGLLALAGLVQRRRTARGLRGIRGRRRAHLFRRERRGVVWLCEVIAHGNNSL